MKKLFMIALVCVASPALGQDSSILYKNPNALRDALNAMTAAAFALG
jgi:hypothetical protein